VNQEQAAESLPFRVPRPRRVCKGGSSVRQTSPGTTSDCLFSRGSSHSHPPILIGTRAETETAVTHGRYTSAEILIGTDLQVFSSEKKEAFARTPQASVGGGPFHE